MDSGKLIVIHEDNHLLAVVKPAGLLVQGDRSGDPTLLEAGKDYLRLKYDKPGKVYLGLVHRLDRPVSGLVLFARTSKAAGRLSRQFREGAVHKTYLAVVRGVPDPDAGELRGWMGAKAEADGRTRLEATPFAGAREALLTYRTLETAAGCALLEVRPVTGRRHQIRVQLAAAGWPILGDVKYGADAPLPDRVVALHALRLEVAHPVGGAALVLEAPLPAHWPWPPGGAGEPGGAR